MVGRESELRRLLDTAAAVGAGHPATALVVGEPGIGKSRLVAELASVLREAGWIVCVGHGVSLSGGEMPFGVLAETLRDLIREVGEDRVRRILGVRTAALGWLVPALAEPGRTSGLPDRTVVISTVVDLFEAIGVEQPMCWVVEDLQWLDTSSRDVFRYVTQAGRQRLLTVATLRPIQGGYVDEMAANAQVEVVELARLGSDDARSQLRELVVQLPHLSTGDIGRLAVLSEGVPFLAEELAATWNGSAPDPHLLRRLMSARVKSLSPAGLDLVQSACLGESQLTVGLLETLGFDARVVGEAMAAGILEVDRSQARLRFSHSLLREAIEDSLTPAEQAHRHRR